MEKILRVTHRSDERTLIDTMGARLFGEKLTKSVAKGVRWAAVKRRSKEIDVFQSHRMAGPR